MSDVTQDDMIRLDVHSLDEVPKKGYYMAVLLDENDEEYMLCFVLDGEFHKLSEGPAVVDFIGRCEFYEHGKRTRQTYPAVLHATGLFEFWVDDKRHRYDGPAIHNLGEEQRIWVRNDNVCVIIADEPEEMSDEDLAAKYGPGHRFDGDEYYINGEHLTRDQWLSHLEDTGGKDTAR